MSIASKLASLRAALLRFSAADGGNIAVIFGIVLVPILGFMGTAVDYSRVSKYRTQMQAAIDSANLMVSRDVAATPTMTATQITTKAQDYFNALFKAGEVTGVTVTANYSSSGSTTLTMTGQGTITTQFLKVIGFPTLPINVNSKTNWGQSALRIALVLDSTGSMRDDSKMVEMKKAATAFVTSMSALAKNPGDVYISLIPFAKDVNVGPTNLAASWVDWSDYNSKNSSTSTSQGACEAWFLFFCVRYATITTTTVKPWTGCIMDRTQNYDISNAAPSSNVQAGFPAEDYSGTVAGTPGTVYFCDPANVALSKPYLQPMMPLTSSFDLINTSINAMTPTGGTNQAIGMAWAWQSLTEGAPMNAPSKSSNVKYNEIVVLLSDGLNTQNRVYGNGSDPSPDVDARQALLCSAMKTNAKITIYAIQVNTSTTNPDPLSTVMQNCASRSDFFKMVTSAAAIGNVFKDIQNSITKLRIAE